MAETASGLLFVYAEPGDHVSEQELNDWYDEEHIPPLTSHPDFRTLTRYKAADDKKPSWLAFYDLTSPEVASAENLGKLLASASDRERAVISNLAMLNRRVLSLKVSRSPPNTPPTLRGKFALVILMQPSPEREKELVRWYEEEHMDVFGKTPGWIRGRVFKVVDGPTEMAGKSSAELTTNARLTYLAIHEVESKESLASPEAQNSLNTPWGEIMKADVGDNLEQRVFELYKDFPKTA